MPALWDSKVTFVSVSQFLGVSLVLPLSICLCTLCNSTSYYLIWGKKKKEKKKKRGSKKKKKNTKPPVDSKLVQRVLLVFLDATGRGGLGFAFLPTVLTGWDQVWVGISPFVLSQVLHEVPGSIQPLNLWVPSMSQSQAQCPRQAEPVSGCAAEISLRARQPLLESSLQSSCLPFLTST